MVGRWPGAIVGMFSCDTFFPLGPSAEMGHGFPVTGNVLLTAQFSNVLPFKSILQEVCGRRTCLFFRYWLQACLNARLRKLYRTTEGHISDPTILLLRENPTAFVLSESVSHFCTGAEMA